LGTSLIKKVEAYKNEITGWLLFFGTMFVVMVGTREMGLTWDETLAYMRGSEVFLEWLSQVQQRILAGQWSSIWDPVFHEKYWPLMTAAN